jgi:1-acyl-sn-glycerol-3-phosphate acyltransferase
MAETKILGWMWYEGCRVLVRLAFTYAFQIRYSGQENIPLSGGVLVASNHQSHLDPPLVGGGCKRRMSYLARDSLFRFAPFAWLIRSFDAIPIDREGLGLSGVKETLRRLKQGKMVLVFPEATRTRDGEMGRFKPGFATMAVRSKAAILPAAIEGAYQVWPRRQRFPGLGIIHVHYGPPLLPHEFGSRGERELVEEVERRVRECQALVRQRPVFAARR